MEPIDEITLNFSEGNLTLLNLSLGFIMFGVALNLDLKDFKLVWGQPLSTLLGLVSQFLLLPLLTYLLVLAFQPLPSFALGMMMVAACPGGNISNFFSSMAKGNIALSVSLTAVSSALSIFMTPINLALWASLYEPTSSLLTEISIDYWDVLKTILMIMGIPIILGMTVKTKWPALAKKMHPFMHYASIGIFAGIIAMAFSANISIFTNYIHMVLGLVFIHNAVALATGYGIGAAFRIPSADRRSLSIETGIQNSGLGLLLIFAFFNGLGGMAIIAAWWGIWHIVSGMIVSLWWNRKPPEE